MRARVLIFLAGLLADAFLIHQQPWSLVVGVVLYVVVVYPALRP